MAKRIGEILVEHGLINESQLDMALEEQRSNGKFLGEIIVDLGFAEEDDLLRTLAEQFHTKFVNLKQIKVSAEVLRLVPRAMAWEYRFMPIDMRSAVILIAVSNPLDMWPMSHLKDKLNLSEVTIVLARKDDILDALNEHYGPEIGGIGMQDWIEQYLIKKQKVSKEHLDESKAEHQKSGVPIGKILIKKGYIQESDLARALAEQYRIPFINLSKFIVAKEVIEKVPPKLAMHYKMVPIKLENGTLTVAIADPQDVRLLDDIRVALKAQYRIETVLSTESEIQSAIKRYYGLGADTVEGIIRKSGDESAQTGEEEEKESGVEDLEKMAGDASVVKLVNQVLLEAWNKRATDIHIEPYRSRLQLRYRVDGILYPADMPDRIRRFLPAIISRIKIMSNLNIVERRLPQDGRATVKAGQHKMDLRISVLPTPHGESVVIRILPTSMLFRLEDLGLNLEHQQSLEQLILKPYGIVFVTGPTGAGKSTTLYASLSKINTKDRKIITIEDPIEYELEGITQIQVFPQIGLSFAQGLRSMLRHDPDVMMVGEVRDYETAELAIRIALTGHLVFSTLHTNDAASAVTRLLDMGVDPFLIVSSVECFIAQRLVRVICPECKTEDKREVTPELKNEIMQSAGIQEHELKLYIGEGCEHCNMSGYRGRTGIHEFLVLNKGMKKLIMEKRSSDEIKQVAKQEGVRSLREDGWGKILQGMTTIDEILRVTQIAGDDAEAV